MFIMAFVGRLSALAELTIYPSKIKPKSEAAIAS